jgi:uroporphyrin-III C-methyltransferase/precorrin-2 dehydrogenase/sirohydrochlorin ferrochelatase
MDYLPLFTRLADSPCLIVGAGTVAARKLSLLARTGARITVVAPEAVTEIRELAESGKLVWQQREFEAIDLAHMRLVIAATSEHTVNAAVAAAAREAGCPCNVVDNLELSTAILPAIVDRAPFVIAVSSAGRSPVLATQVRQRIERMLPANFGSLADWAGKWRPTVKTALAEPAERLRFWQQTLSGNIAERVLADDIDSADQLVEKQLRDNKEPQRGVGWLVGAGPGDPELLTVKALRCIETADVIIHDRLVARSILKHARRDAEIISVGKVPGRDSIKQPAINELLVSKVRAGLRVCRLKGGDPFIFGRGGEEVAALASARLDYAVVPGITAAAGCAAALAVPLTHREVARSVTFVTGHTADGSEPDWSSLAATDQTVVLYMSLRSLAETCTKLIAAGRPADCPALLIENGTTPHQRTLAANLTLLPEVAVAESFSSPALLIVGDVATWATKPDSQSGADQGSPWLPAADTASNLGG